MECLFSWHFLLDSKRCWVKRFNFSILFTKINFLSVCKPSVLFMGILILQLQSRKKEEPMYFFSFYVIFP